MAAEPAPERRLDADAHDDGPRGLRALLHAAAAGLHLDRAVQPVRQHDGRAGGDEERHRPVRARQLPRCRDHPADHPRPEGRARWLLEAGDEPPRRRPVRRPRPPDAFQLQSRATTTASSSPAPTSSATSPPTATWRPHSSGASASNTAQSLFSADDLAYSYNHYIAHGPRPAHHGVRRRLLSSGWARASAWTSWQGSGLRRTVVHPNDSTVPSYQTANIGISRKCQRGRPVARSRRASISPTCGTSSTRSATAAGLGVFAPQSDVRTRLLRGTQDGLLIEVAKPPHPSVPMNRSGAAKESPMQKCQSFAAILRVGGATIYPLLVARRRRGGGDRREGLRLRARAPRAARRCWPWSRPTASIWEELERESRARSAPATTSRRFFRIILENRKRPVVVGRVARHRGAEPDRASRSAGGCGFSRPSSPRRLSSACSAPSPA